MDTLVLTTLLFNTTGIAVMATGMALAYCAPGRRRPRQWVAAEAAAMARVPVAAQLAHAA